MWSTINKSGNVEFRESFKDPLTGERKSACVTFTKDTAANRKLASQELQRIIAEKTRMYDTDPLSMKELLVKYMDFQEKTVKKSTLERNKRTLDKIVPIIGEDIIVNNLKAGFVKDKLLSLTTNPTTLNEYLKRLKGMLRWGYESDYLDNYRLITKLTSFKDKTTREKIADKFLEPEEAHKLLGYMKDSQELWYLVTKFQLLSGMRIGELIALEDKDINGNFIRVNKTYDHINDLITPPKTPESDREVFIQPELAQCIKAIRRWRRTFALMNGIRSPLFIFTETGEYISYDAYEKYLKENGKRVLNRDKITTHVLRHTHASFLAAEGVPLETIMRRLGHANSRITREIYIHVTKKVRENDNNILRATKIL